MSSGRRYRSKRGEEEPRDRSRSRRSRSRDRERSRGRSRSRSASFRLERSVSRDLLEGNDTPKVVKKIVENQQELLYQWLSEHKAEVEEKLQARTRRFSSKAIERQYQVNAGFKEQATKILVALEAGEVKRAKDVAEALEAGLQEHEEDLIIADTSQHGWLAVARLRRGSELSKSLRKKLDQVDRELSAQKKPDGGGFKKKFGQVSRQDKEPLVNRQNKRLSPEELLFQAGKQLRPGSCTHCHEGLHYFKECPSFWAKVQESRKAKAKGEETN
jgi:hypothetical protein